MTITVKHNKTNAIADWTQAQLDEQIALGNFAPGTTLANIVLPSDWNDDHTFTGTLDVGNGGTGATTLTGYVKGNGTSALTASATIPNTDISGLGTISTQNANNVAITGGSINGTTIGATTASTGKFTSVTTPSVTATTTDLTLSAISTGAVKFSTAGGLQAQISNTASSANYWQLTGSATTASPVISVQGTDSNIPLQIATKGSGDISLYQSGAVIFKTFYLTASPTSYWGVSTNASGNPILRTLGTAATAYIDNGNPNDISFRTNAITSGTVQFNIANTASAVNYVQVTGATTTNGPLISAQGSDGTVGLNFSPKGGGQVVFLQNGIGTPKMLTLSTVGGAVNYFDITPSLTNTAPKLSPVGSDTNISMAFQPKGTGAIDLAAGSSGVNISNGGTVTALTRTVTGTGYTTNPTVVIPAPTTAGGVQATATCVIGITGGATIVSGGTGYTVGDTLTVSGGTNTAAATFTVSSVSGGVITAITLTSAGSYTVAPSNPVSVTGGTGTGATFNGVWGIGATLTITNAGSGYIEQPTVSFSGGGGSGASAYATVGSTTIVRGLGTNIDFYVPSSISSSSPALRIADGGSSTIYPQINNFGSTVNILAAGATNTQLLLGSNGTSPITLSTNGTSRVEQLRVSHTASAVNYVQVTGGATTANPTISVQGSDGTRGLNFTTKGSSYFNLYNQAGTTQVFSAGGANASNGNWISVVSNALGSSPSITSAGGDTNIDLALTPKGTGVVQFGTHTANADTAISGYITIRDAGGTLRKLAVIT